MRATAFAVLFISFTAAAQTGASVCGTIYASDEKVRCLQGIAGHTVEPAAAAVCGTIYAGNEKAACLKAAIDKHYQPDELAACRSIYAGNDKANCIRAAGVLPQAPVVERPRSRRVDDDEEDDEDDRPSRRSRRERRRERDDEDEDDAPSRAQRNLRLTNYFSGVVSRFYWRRPDDRRFKEVPLAAVLNANTYQDFTLPSETLEICIETPDGFRLHWARVKRSEELIIAATERNWAVARCRDLR